MNIADLPNTPRAQFEGLTGKRPDLCLCDPLHSPKANLVSLKLGRVKLSTEGEGDTIWQAVVWTAPEKDCEVVLVGGVN
jgi:hypothetical protein